MSSRGPATNDDVEVTWEDQQKICAFGRLTGKAHELQSLVSAKEVHIESAYIGVVVVVISFSILDDAFFGLDFPALFLLLLIIMFDSSRLGDDIEYY